MDRKILFRLMGGGALVLGVLGFLAIPPHSGSFNPYPGLGPGLGHPGVPGFYQSRYTCGIFEVARVCGPNFWLRTGVFAIGAIVAAVFFILAEQSDAVGTASRSYQPRNDFAPDTVSPRPRVPGGGVPPPSPSSRTGMKACPDCAEEVRAAARKCRFCGYEFVDETTP